MSRKSDNTRANSAGDGDSLLSSYENSPRNKTSELKITGPCGDYSTAHVRTSNIIIYTTNSSTDSEDHECLELKMEYMQRINQIREKLATIDIANKSYYDSCFAYPPDSEESQCKITEIFDEDAQMHEKDQNHQTFIAETIIEEIPETKSTLDESKPQSFSSKGSDTEFKTILDYSASFKEISSSIELLDLNYNPPKKRTCIRENTPKIIVSDGAVSLPYHIRVSLDDVISKSDKNPGGQQQLENESMAAAKAEVITKTPTERPNHIFPKVQIECAEKDSLSTKESNSRLDQNGAATSPQDTAKENVCVLFLDPLEQSASVSPRSTNRSRATEITSTTDSSLRKGKRRRLVLRSASNKVKPTDKISIWEEIRTMEALMKKKRPLSSSSHDSHFRNVLLSTEKDQAIDINAIGSLEVPRKSKKATRFPSITKITRLCSSVFKKSNSAEAKELQESNPENDKNKPYIMPKVANTLFNIKIDQEVDLDLGNTPTGERFSQCSYPDEDDFDASSPFCLFCFCF